MNKKLISYLNIIVIVFICLSLLFIIIAGDDSQDSPDIVWNPDKSKTKLYCKTTQTKCETSDECNKKCMESTALGEEMICDPDIKMCVPDKDDKIKEACDPKNGELVWTGWNDPNRMGWDCVCKNPDTTAAQQCGINSDGKYECKNYCIRNADICRPGDLSGNTDCNCKKPRYDLRKSDNQDQAICVRDNVNNELPRFLLYTDIYEQNICNPREVECGPDGCGKYKSIRNLINKQCADGKICNLNDKDLKSCEKDEDCDDEKCYNGRCGVDNKEFGQKCYHRTKSGGDGEPNIVLECSTGVYQKDLDRFKKDPKNSSILNEYASTFQEVNACIDHDIIKDTWTANNISDSSTIASVIENQKYTDINATQLSDILKSTKYSEIPYPCDISNCDLSSCGQSSQCDLEAGNLIFTGDANKTIGIGVSKVNLKGLCYEKGTDISKTTKDECVCKDNYYDNKCYTYCNDKQGDPSNNCFGGTCNPDTGSCDCNGMFYGRQCDKVCPGVIDKDGNPCDPSDPTKECVSACGGNGSCNSETGECMCNKPVCNKTITEFRNGWIKDENGSCTISCNHVKYDNDKTNMCENLNKCFNQSCAVTETEKDIEKTSATYSNLGFDQQEIDKALNDLTGWVKGQPFVPALGKDCPFKDASGNPHIAKCNVMKYYDVFTNGLREFQGSGASKTNINESQCLTTAGDLSPTTSNVGVDIIPRRLLQDGAKNIGYILQENTDQLGNVTPSYCSGSDAECKNAQDEETCIKSQVQGKGCIWQQTDTIRQLETKCEDKTRWGLSCEKQGPGMTPDGKVCSGHGKLNINGNCVCENGYTKEDCSYHCKCGEQSGANFTCILDKDGKEVCICQTQNLPPKDQDSSRVGEHCQIDCNNRDISCNYKIDCMLKNYLDFNHIDYDGGDVQETVDKNFENCKNEFLNTNIDCKPEDYAISCCDWASNKTATIDSNTGKCQLPEKTCEKDSDCGEDGKCNEMYGKTKYCQNDNKNQCVTKNAIDSDCDKGCKPGWWGKNCESLCPVSEIDKDGNVLKYCSGKDLQDSEHRSKGCDRLTGKCICNSDNTGNFHGNSCESCEDSFYCTTSGSSQAICSTPEKTVTTICGTKCGCDKDHCCINVDAKSSTSSLKNTCIRNDGADGYFEKCEPLHDGQRHCRVTQSDGGMNATVCDYTDYFATSTCSVVNPPAGVSKQSGYCLAPCENPPCGVEYCKANEWWKGTPTCECKE